MTSQPLPQSKHVYQAILAITLDMSQEGISKSRKNEQQGYNFRGIDEVLNALSPMLAKHKLNILPRVTERTCVERATQKGGVLFYVTVKAEFDFVSAVDDSVHTVVTYGEAMDSADKATNKAMSAAYKYAAFQAFCIPTEGDNDADATTHEVAPKQAKQIKAQEPEKKWSSKAGANAQENPRVVQARKIYAQLNKEKDPSLFDDMWFLNREFIDTLATSDNPDEVNAYNAMIKLSKEREGAK